VKWLLAVLITVLAAPAAFAEPDEVARTEIAHLLKYLETSGCQFQRNGSWYASTRAASHLNQKYEYLLKKDMVASAEQFIERAATESSASGKPYAVKCGDAAAVPSAEWLRADLQRFRTRKEN
jgi:hypothetical protein